MSQLYVGKRPISKGIGRLIRRFVVLSLAPAGLIGPQHLNAARRPHPILAVVGLEQFRRGNRVP
jgi:hypothetical protein